MGSLLEITGTHQPVGVVVGLPLAADGSEAESTVRARELADQLRVRPGLPLELWDERMTTSRALGVIREQGGSTRGRKEDVDALAAAVMLQGFLEARRKRAEKTER
jgi:putative holliday junction resolvase